MNTNTKLTLTRLRRAKQTRYNPLSSIADPAQMTRKLDAFEVGHFKEAVNIWDSLEQRDDLVRAVVSKRKKAVGRQGWTVLIHDSVPAEKRAEAEAQALALEYFYRHLRCENALDRSERGGFKLLCRQMMDAIGKRFAVHEIVWKTSSFSSLPYVENTPSPSAVDTSPSSTSDFKPRTSNLDAPLRLCGESETLLTATFRFVPLGFFENTTGTLRFLEHETALEGIPLQPGAWMITTGEGLMMATATAWMLKHIALNDWLLYAERNGRPIIRGTTAAAENSPEWQALETAVEEILNGNAVVHSSSDDVKVLDLAVGGSIPYPDLVDRIDRMIAALWRGADLSTMSRDRGYGASLQEKETCSLEEDDAELLTETLNEYVDKWVIRYLFGDDVQPLANVKVLVTPKECTTADLEIDQFLYKAGAPLGLHDLMTRYGRALPKPGEPVIQLNVAASLQGAPSDVRSSRSHETHSNHSPTEARASASAPSYPCPSAPSVVESLFSPFPPVQNSSPSSLCSPCLSGESPSAVNNPVTGLPNTFTLLQSDWLQLSPYGDFPHVRGLQRVDREAAETMARQFNGFRARLGRLFGGAPFYVGHPDLPQTSELADRKAYGWVMQLEARDDGLYGFVKWSDAGLDLLQQAHYKYLSPFWEAKQIGAENGRPVFRPTALLSVGLTNQPNIPVKPLANSGDTSQPNNCSSRRQEALEQINPYSEARASASAPSSPPSASPAPSAVENSPPPSLCSPCLGGESPSGVKPPFPLCPSVENSAIRTSIREAKVSSGETNSRRAWEAHPQFAVKSPSVQNLALTALHTRSITENLGTRRGERFLHNTRHKIRQAVKSKMRLGQTYEDAWRTVKEEHHDWFANQH